MMSGRLNYLQQTNWLPSIVLLRLRQLLKIIKTQITRHCWTSSTRQDTRSDIHEPINSTGDEEKLPQQWKELIITVSTDKSVIKRTALIIGPVTVIEYIKFYSTFSSQGQPHTRTKLLGIIHVDFDVTGQQLVTTHSALVKYLRKNANAVGQCGKYLHTWRKSIKLGKRFRMTCSRSWHLDDTSSVNKVMFQWNRWWRPDREAFVWHISYLELSQRDVLSPLPFKFALDYVIRKAQANQQVAKFNGKHQRVFYADDITSLIKIIHIKGKTTKYLLVATVQTV